MPIRKKLFRKTLIYLLLGSLSVWIGHAADYWTLTARADDLISYSNYNVTLALQDNGDLRVRMLQRIKFHGEFSQAFLEIPTDFTSGIEEVSVWQASAPTDNDNLTDPSLSAANFTVNQGAGAVEVKWTYPPTTAGETRLFVVEFTAAGALWVYRDQDILRWEAINADRSGFDIESALVTVELPPYIPADSVGYDANGASHSASLVGQEVIYTVGERLEDGQAFAVEVSFPRGLVNAEVQSWQKEEDAESLEISINRFDIDLKLAEDGSLSVREEMEIAVVHGVLYDAYRTIPLLYLDDVDSVLLSQDGQALTNTGSTCVGCFKMTKTPSAQDWVYYSEYSDQVQVNEERAGSVIIDWSIQPLYSGDTALFEIEYHVIGALRIDDDSQLLTWQLVPLYEIPVESARAAISLPPGVKPEDATILSNGQSVEGEPTQNGTLALYHNGPVEAQYGWNLTMTLPPDATFAAIPSWQSEFAAALDEAGHAAVSRARRKLLISVLAILFALATILGAGLWWLRSGRRQIRERLGGYRSEPPSHLSPGIVSYLVDGSATEKSVLASLFHLATAGCLEISLDGALWLRRMRSEALHAGERLRPNGEVSIEIDRETHALCDRHTAYLFNKIVLPNTENNRYKALDTLSDAFKIHLPILYANMGLDVQGHLLTRRSPIYGANWIQPALMFGWFVFSAAVMYGSFASQVRFGSAAFLIFSSFVAVSLLNMARSWLLARGQNGSGEAEIAEWIRFKNYLTDLKLYGDLGSAQQILEQFFAYAVALGVEQDVLDFADSIGTATPSWMPALPPTSISSRAPGVSQAPNAGQTPRSVRPRNVLALAATRSGERYTRPGGQRPRRTSLAGMSRQLGASLATASASVGKLLATAAGDVDGSEINVRLSNQLGTTPWGVNSRELSWRPGTTVGHVIDDILKQSIADARTIARKRQSQSRRGTGKPAGGSSRRDSVFRSGGGFQRRSSSSRSGNRTSRRGGGGRSGFG